jgi:hypothetical protein
METLNPEPATVGNGLKNNSWGELYLDERLRMSSHNIFR